MEISPIRTLRFTSSNVIIGQMPLLVFINLLPEANPLNEG